MKTKRDGNDGVALIADGLPHYGEIAGQHHSSRWKLLCRFVACKVVGIWYYKIFGHFICCCV